MSVERKSGWRRRGRRQLGKRRGPGMAINRELRGRIQAAAWQLIEEKLAAEGGPALLEKRFVEIEDEACEVADALAQEIMRLMAARQGGGGAGPRSSGWPRCHRGGQRGGRGRGGDCRFASGWRRRRRRVARKVSGVNRKSHVCCGCTARCTASILVRSCRRVLRTSRGCPIYAEKSRAFRGRSPPWRNRGGSWMGRAAASRAGWRGTAGGHGG